MGARQTQRRRLHGRLRIFIPAFGATASSVTCLLLRYRLFYIHACSFYFTVCFKCIWGVRFDLSRIKLMFWVTLWFLKTSTNRDSCVGLVRSRENKVILFLGHWRSYYFSLTKLQFRKITLCSLKKNLAHTRHE